jgi:hypothetical protein
MQFYQDKMKGMGMKASTVTSGSGGIVNGADNNSHRPLNVIVGASSGHTTVVVTYGSK